jgi:molecular chaperone GrpE
MAEQEKDMEETLQDEQPVTDQPGAEEENAANAECEEARESEESTSAEAEEASEEITEEAPEGEDPKSWAERRAAKKQAKLDKKADAYKEQITQLEDKVKRQLAEFENFRNRTEKEKQAMFETGAKSVIEKMLPIVDNFERGLATVPDDKKEDPFVDGMMRIYKQLLTELDNIGVKPIEAVGKEFDPNLHNAVMQVESEEYESGIVARELQKGYTYRDNVVRHSMVAVTE